ncbi:MAG TPA: FUSC family protein [Nocardioides sp.]|nr:FUSC family protein [Nocardioides sp.]
MRVLRRGWILFTASDPGFARLRLASTTLAALVIAVLAVAGIAVAWGQPVTAAVVGVVVTMIACLAVTDPTTRDRAISTALLVPGVAVSATLATTFRGHLLVSDAVFVLVMVGAVYLRRLGPRGLAVGMMAFVAYFLVLFVQAQPAQLPVMIVCAAAGATVAFLVRTALRSRHPDRDLRRELSAWSVRAGRVLATLGEAVEAGRWEGRTGSRLRHRMLSCSGAAAAAETRLEGADEQLWPEVDNEELGVRVFDAQLALERVVSLCVDRVDGDEHADPAGPGGRALPPEERVALVAALGDLRARLGTSVASRRAASGRPDLDPILASALDRCAEAWQRAWRPEPDPDQDTSSAPDPGPDATADHDDHGPSGGAAGDEDDTEDDDSGTPGWRDLSRTALQVAVAAVVAIALGELLSPTRWFWAVIAAFVVFTGTSTREETLRKGWLRVVGTLAGVVSGVLVASLIGGRTVPALVTVAACIFLGIYLLRISLAWMMFFITTMLGLLYGLVGMFSVGLLVTRLEETVAGAAAGALAAYVVLPQRARQEAAQDVVDVLASLEDLLDTVGRTLTGRSDEDDDGPLAGARELRTTMDTLRTTADPLTGPLAGLTNRTGLRRVVMVVGACEHHGRALARVADAAAGMASGPRLAGPVSEAVSAVAGTVRAVRPAFDAADQSLLVDLPEVDAELEVLRRLCGELPGPEHDLLRSALRHLRAIDDAMRRLARDLGGGSRLSPGSGPGPARESERTAVA